jgi:hypothetical protein
MDSPSLFTEWAGIYSNNMKNGGYGMWAFKFANTTSSTYLRGIKSGHHLTWQGEKIVEDAFTNIALGKKVRATDGIAPQHVTDGDKSDQSAWICASAGEKWIEINLGKKQKIGSAVIYTGSASDLYTGFDRMRNLSLQYFNNNVWTDIKGASVTGSKYTQVYFPFQEPVETNKIRLVSDDSTVKVREIKLFCEQSLSKDGNCYDVAGIQRTGEVVRLFAKGFKNGRKLLETVSSVNDPDLDVCVSFDEVGNLYYVWIVQRNHFTYHLNFDLSDLNVVSGTPVFIEEVSPQYHGEIVHDKIYTDFLKVSVPPQSVSLVSIPASGHLTKSVINTDADAVVKCGNYSTKNFGKSDMMTISLNTSTEEKNHVAYMQFDLSGIDLEKIEKAVISVHGFNPADDAPFRIHVYAIANKKWNENNICWNTAPNLSGYESQIIFDKDISVAGQIVLNQTEQYHKLDITGILKRHTNKSLTFVAIRELRQMGDDVDKNRSGVIHSRESGYPPYLEIWQKSNINK